MVISWHHALVVVVIVGCFGAWFFLQAKGRKSSQERHILESAFNQACPVCITDANFEIIKANEAYWSVFGRSKDPERPIKCFEHRPGKACHTDNCPLTNILNGQKKYICEPQKEYDGEIHYFIVVAQPYYGYGGEQGKATGVIEVFYDITEKKRLEDERARLIIDLEESLKKVKLLSGMIPICASCKKIRDDDGYWSQVETYIARHSEAMFSHGICPDCVKVLYPDVYPEIFPDGHETKGDRRRAAPLISSCLRGEGGKREVGLGGAA